MSTNDVTQDTYIQDDDSALNDANNSELEGENVEAVAADAGSSEEEFEGYEVIEQLQEPSPDSEEKKRNAAMARQRIEAREAKKRAKQLEEELERVQRGEIPDSLKERLVVAPQMPDQPNIQDYISDEALSKYDYDKDVAMAAFSQANNKWLLDAQNARSTSQVNEAKARQDFVIQQKEAIESAKKYNEAAEEMSLSGFDDAEKVFIEMAGGPGALNVVNEVFSSDPKKSVAVVNFLGKNPAELERILRMSPTRQIAELSVLGNSRLQLRKKKTGQAPEADGALTGGETSHSDNWKKQLSNAMSGDTAKFRELKREWEQKLGRSIAYSEIP